MVDRLWKYLPEDQGLDILTHLNQPTSITSSLTTHLPLVHRMLPMRA